MQIAASDKGITSVYFTEKESEEKFPNSIVLDCIHQLQEYFYGERKNFFLPLDLHGTEFQRRVWSELLKIPFGRTVSYQYIAKKLGDKNLLRAVGNANGKNPVSIIIPCHRVIGADGDLVGYGSGLHRKKWLLEFEGAMVPKLFD